MGDLELVRSRKIYQNNPSFSAKEDALELIRQIEQELQK
jgi:hypothetical protein